MHVPALHLAVISRRHWIVALNLLLPMFALDFCSLCFADFACFVALDQLLLLLLWVPWAGVLFPLPFAMLRPGKLCCCL